MPLILNSLNILTPSNEMGCVNMENKVSERNVVLGLTIVSMLLVAGTMVMPAMIAPQSDVAHGLTVACACRAAASGNLVDILLSLGCLWAELAGLCAAGPAGIAALIVYA